MKTSIQQVTSKQEMKTFIRFNYHMYKDNPYSVPDLYEDMMSTFSDKNPAMEFCQAAYFLAYQERKVVGRVAAIINHRGLISLTTWMSAGRCWKQWNNTENFME